MTRLQPAHQACLEGDHPYILSPFASTAQRISKLSSNIEMSFMKHMYPVCCLRMIPLCYFTRHWLLKCQLIRILTLPLPQWLPIIPPYRTSPTVITKPGNEPSISYGIDALEENMSLLDPIFRKMSHRKRKAYFAKRSVSSIFFDIVFDYLKSKFLFNSWHLERTWHAIPLTLRLCIHLTYTNTG